MRLDKYQNKRGENYVRETGYMKPINWRLDEKNRNRERHLQNKENQLECDRTTRQPIIDC